MSAKKLVQAGIVRVVYDQDYDLNVEAVEAFLAKLDHITVVKMQLP